MPLQWRRDHNPYLHNPFGILGVGPNTPPDHIAAVAEQLARRAKVGQPPRLAGQPLGPPQIREARNRLLDDRTRAPELLLAHPETQVGLKSAIACRLTKRVQEPERVVDRPHAFCL